MPINLQWLIDGLQHISQRYGQNGEEGIDLALPFHTPITALTSGYIAAVGYVNGVGGIVAEEVIINHVPTDIYYQHLDDNLVKVGQLVSQGDPIGLSGGQLGYGDHPASPQFSTGPHIEIGINPPGGGLANPDNMTPHTDPLPLLQQIANGTATITPTQQNTGGVAGTVASTATGAINDVTGGVIAAILAAFKLPSLVDLGYRALFVLIGIIFLIIGLLIFLRGPLEDAGKLALEAV